MEADVLDLPELARYLKRDARDLEKLASQGRLPGRRIGGRWTVHVSQVHEWLEQSLPDCSDPELKLVETAVASGDEGPVIAPLLAVETTAVPLEARTATAALEELVRVANGTWQVYDPERVLAAVRAREAESSTALPGGVAIPHPGRRMNDALGAPILAIGRTPSGLPFNSPDGGLTDVFFLILCLDNKSHLRTLARLTRMFLRGTVLDDLRAANSAAELLDVLRVAEDEMTTAPRPT